MARNPRYYERKNGYVEWTGDFGDGGIAELHELLGNGWINEPFRYLGASEPNYAFADLTETLCTLPQANLELNLQFYRSTIIRFLEKYPPRDVNLARDRHAPPVLYLLLAGEHEIIRKLAELRLFRGMPDYFFKLPSIPAEGRRKWFIESKDGELAYRGMMNLNGPDIQKVTYPDTPLSMSTPETINQFTIAYNDHMFNLDTVVRTVFPMAYEPLVAMGISPVGMSELAKHAQAAQ